MNRQPMMKEPQMSYSFLRTHAKTVDAMQAGDSNLAYSMFRLLVMIAESDEKLAIKRYWLGR